MLKRTLQTAALIFAFHSFVEASQDEPQFSSSLKREFKAVYSLTCVSSSAMATTVPTNEVLRSGLDLMVSPFRAMGSDYNKLRSAYREWKINDKMIEAYYKLLHINNNLLKFYLFLIRYDPSMLEGYYKLLGFRGDIIKEIQNHIQISRESEVKTFSSFPDFGPNLTSSITLSSPLSSSPFTKVEPISIQSEAVSLALPAYIGLLPLSFSQSHTTSATRNILNVSSSSAFQRVKRNSLHRHTLKYNPYGK